MLSETIGVVKTRPMNIYWKWITSGSLEWIFRPTAKKNDIDIFSSNIYPLTLFERKKKQHLKLVSMKAYLNYFDGKNSRWRVLQYFV